MTEGRTGAAALLGLDGFVLLGALEVDGELHQLVETTADRVGCRSCGVVATAHARRTVKVRDLPAGGRPVVLVWSKRVWRCEDPDCEVRTWTEVSAAGRSESGAHRAGPTRRLQAGGQGRPLVGEFRRMARSAQPEVRPLSEREREVLVLVARGHSYREVAAELYISPKTVENHVRNILEKLQLRSRPQLTRYALEHGLE